MFMTLIIREILYICGIGLFHDYCLIYSSEFHAPKISRFIYCRHISAQKLTDKIRSNMTKFQTKLRDIVKECIVKMLTVDAVGLDLNRVCT